MEMAKNNPELMNMAKKNAPDMLKMAANKDKAGLMNMAKKNGPGLLAMAGKFK